MSYSVCFLCEQVVSYYEKYCEECVQLFDLKQDKDYWKKGEFEKNLRERFAKIIEDIQG